MTVPAWIVVIAFAYALILLAAWAVVHGGNRKPTPPVDEESRADGLHRMGDAADTMFRERFHRWPL